MNSISEIYSIPEVVARIIREVEEVAAQMYTDGRGFPDENPYADQGERPADLIRRGKYDIWNKHIEKLRK